MSLPIPTVSMIRLMQNVDRWNSGIKGSGEIQDKWMGVVLFFGMIVDRRAGKKLWHSRIVRL